MHRSKVKRSLIAILLVVVALFFIAGTYARYSTTANANAVADVASWAVTISHDDTELSNIATNITFVVDDNDYVVSGKIAPATRATAEIELDLTGTEVAVDFATLIDTDALAEVLGANDEISFTTTFNGVTYSSEDVVVIPLENGEAFDSTNGVKTLTLAIEWENNDENNAADTALGKETLANRTIVVPVTLTAQQHISD